MGKSDMEIGNLWKVNIYGKYLIIRHTQVKDLKLVGLLH